MELHVFRLWHYDYACRSEQAHSLVFMLGLCSIM